MESASTLGRMDNAASGIIDLRYRHCKPDLHIFAAKGSWLRGITFTDQDDMLFNVLHELRQGMGAVNEYDLREPEVKAADLMLRDVEGWVRFLRTDRGLLAKVHATATIDEECSRCLAPVATPVTVDFEEEYVPLLDANTSAPVHIDPSEEEDTFRVSIRFELDLREALRQYILMYEPTKPLCRADCAGLCPDCGADMNIGPHECEQPTDGRWSALAGLKSETTEGN
jgi:uncharacterized protein